MLKCWNVEMLKCWDAEVLKCWNDEILKCWNAKNAKMLELWNYELVKLWYDETMKQWNYEMMKGKPSHCWPQIRSRIQYLVVHYLFLPWRANLGFTLSISPLRYPRSKVSDEVKLSMLGHILLSWRGCFHSFRPSGPNMPEHTELGLISEQTSWLPQGGYLESKYLVCSLWQNH